MSRRTLGYILVAAGIVLLIVGLFADSLGIGSGEASVTSRSPWPRSA